VAEVLVAAPIIERILTIAKGAIKDIKDIIDKVPVILDLGIRIVLAYLEPVINFAGAFVKAIATLISSYLDWIVALANDLFAKLPAYLNALVAQLVRSALQSAVTYVKDLARAFVDIVASALLGAALAIGNVQYAVAKYLVNAFIEVFSYVGRVLREVGRFLVDSIKFAFDSFLHLLTSILKTLPVIGPKVTVTPAPGAITPFDAGEGPKLGTFPDLGKEIKDSFKAGAGLGRNLAEAIFGPTPQEEEQKKKDKAKDAAGAPTLQLEPPPKPTFEGPVFKAPRDSVLPDLLERTKAKPGDGKPTAEGPVAPVNFNGGITVNLNVARLDGDNMQATARAIAENVLQEVQRLAEVERFRRGLPTGSLG
ncbi:MAG TPA: hypothetical protein VH877_18325, partial [Polyangia bacterium]|nr:hypothetical protein [Polyangia bacterium]